MTHTPELKPCPFCGGEARVIYHGDSNFRAHEAQCLSCTATTFATTKSDAIAAWNTRTEAGVVRELVEALRAWEAAQDLDTKALEMSVRAGVEGWLNDPSAQSHICDAQRLAAAAWGKARVLRYVALAKAGAA